MFSKTSKDRLLHVHPDMVFVMNAARVSSPYPFEISQGVRTKAEQAALYAQGRTTPGDIVTWTMNSRHLPGPDGLSKAVDVVIIIGGKAIWDKKMYVKLAEHILTVAKKLNIAVTWGGNFKNRLGLPRPDRPHFELSRDKYP